MSSNITPPHIKHTEQVAHGYIYGHIHHQQYQYAIAITLHNHTNKQTTIQATSHCNQQHYAIIIHSS
jgi:hypothetical protein